MALTDGVFNVGGFKRLPKARSIFGIHIPRRTGAGLLAGFANMPQVQAGGGFGGNFLSGLQGGLQGSLAGVGQFDQMQQAEADRQRQQSMQDTLFPLQQRQLAASAAADEARAWELTHPQPKGEGSKSTFDQMAAALTDPTSPLHPFAQDYLKKLTQPSGPGGLSGGKLSPQALRIFGERAAVSGDLGSWGMGAASTRTDIANEAARLHPNANLAANRAQYDADRNALKVQQNTFDSSTAFSETAMKNLGVLDQLKDRIPETGNTLGNKVARKAAELAGDPYVPMFNASLEVVRAELMRILAVASAGGSQPISYEAKRDIEAVLSGNFTRRQLAGVAQVFKQDAANKQASYLERTRAIRARIASYEAAGGGQPMGEQLPQLAPTGGWGLNANGEPTQPLEEFIR